MIEIHFEEEHEAKIVYEHIMAGTRRQGSAADVQMSAKTVTVHVPAAEERYVADIVIPSLVRFILEVKENQWLLSILREAFYFEDPEEQQQIIHIIHSILDGERQDIPGLAGESTRTELLLHSLQDVVCGPVSFSFQSYTMFRLKEYTAYLSYLVEAAIDEYKLEQEYQTFVETLRQIIGRRKARLSVLHLVHDGSFLFYDEKGTRLTQDRLLQYIDESIVHTRGMYIDANVIAPLLAISPGTIHLYTAHVDHNMVITIRNVFQERVKLYHVHEFPKFHGICEKGRLLP
ncbi:putative sporulation protein YtxC [Ectobacillus ponti]|uniref:Sporulation protein YtxC n=1 Tax=Ectobacillus ponti TaxID=2961894 RepID=A0AA41X2H1_9BACI|nr:putative sporulation protein YtxC [Ectobacillus ponti]